MLYYLGFWNTQVSDKTSSSLQRIIGIHRLLMKGRGFVSGRTKRNYLYLSDVILQVPLYQNSW